MNRQTLFTILLSMTSFAAQAQRLEVATPIVDCGQTAYQAPVTAEFEVKNHSNAPLRIRDVRVSCGCTTVDYPTTEIAADARFTVRVTYDGMQMGTFDKSVALYAEGEDKPLMLRMKGRVVREVVDYSGSYPYKLGDLLADRTTLEFDDVNRGDRPQQVIHIRNTTSGVVQPVVMHLPNYLKADVSPSKIAPGHSGVVTVTLDSRLLKEMGLTQTSVFLGQFPGDKVSKQKEIEVSAVLLPQFDNLSETELAQAPRLSLSTETLNLGAFDGKKKLKGEVVIRNDGHRTLNVKSLQMFTSGLQVSLNKTSIAPGEEARLKVVADQRQLREARTEPRILMITNDPEHSKVVISIVTE